MVNNNLTFKANRRPTTHLHQRNRNSVSFWLIKTRSNVTNERCQLTSAATLPLRPPKFAYVSSLHLR